MRRFVFITQQVDPDDPVLGATVAKIAAIARRVDEVVVLCDSAVSEALPGNCRVKTFGSRSRLGRGARFEAALAPEVARGPVAVLAHMVPLYAVLAAPLVRPARVPLLLWFTHWRASRLLRLAERVSTRVVSVDRRSFPLASNKVVATGHGIDLSEFHCVEREPSASLRLLALGRTSPAKGLETVIEAVERADADVRLEIVGPAVTDEERAHRATLRAEVREPVPRAEVPALLGRFDALVNNMRAGAPDKVVYEAAATCMPVLASNPVFDELLPEELRFARDDADGLARRIEGLVHMDRPAVGRSLRAKVEASHSVDAWAEKVLEAAR